MIFGSLVCIGNFYNWVVVGILLLDVMFMLYLFGVMKNIDIIVYIEVVFFDLVFGVDKFVVMILEIV